MKANIAAIDFVKIVAQIRNRRRYLRKKGKKLNINDVYRILKQHAKGDEKELIGIVRELCHIPPEQFLSPGVSVVETDFSAVSEIKEVEYDPNMLTKINMELDKIYSGS